MCGVIASFFLKGKSLQISETMAVFHQPPLQLAVLYLSAHTLASPGLLHQLLASRVLPDFTLQGFQRAVTKLLRPTL